MIARITKAYVRRYGDTGQVKAYIEWVDDKGRTGRTEGDGSDDMRPMGMHMAALFARAQREQVAIEKQAW